MGIKGPIGKRSDERVRRNKTGEDGLETQTVQMIGDVEVPDLDLGVETHPMIEDLWDSLPTSGQTKHWEPSDWEYARITMFALNQMLVSGNISAMKLSAVDGMMSKLLLTEGDRRRVKLEVQRTEATGKVINAAEKFNELFEQQREAN